MSPRLTGVLLAEGYKFPPTVTNYRRCYTKMIDTDSFASSETNLEAYEKFTKNGGWDVLSEIETRYDCSGFCF